MVEAAIVLPIFILVIASIISVGMYFMASFQKQCEIQREVIQSVNEDDHIVRRIEINNETSSRIKGLYDGSLGKNYKAYRYSIDEEAMIRAGDLIL